jgi:hypothetical protein
MWCLERKAAVPNAEPASPSLPSYGLAYEDGEVSRFSQLRSKTVARKRDIECKLYAQLRGFRATK